MQYQFTCARQHDSPFILNENGGTKNQELTAISKKIWQYLLKRKIKITDREADKESRQVRDSRKLNSTIVMKLWSIRKHQRYVYLKSVTPITPVHVLENRPFQLGQACFSDNLDSQVCAWFSPFNTHRKGSSESK